jgi:hypothetical protein
MIFNKAHNFKKKKMTSISMKITLNIQTNHKEALMNNQTNNLKSKINLILKLIHLLTLNIFRKIIINYLRKILIIQSTNCLLSHSIHFNSKK